MRKNARRLLGLMLALMMIAGAAGTALGEEGKITLSGYEFNTAPVTLTAYIDWPNSYGPWGTDMVSAWITDTVGVTLEETFATTGTSEELNLLLVSGNKLPDIIVCAGGSAVAKTLVREGYVEPLDELAKEYFPGFMELLPDQMDVIYQEEDGHLYHTADWFADTKRLDQMIAERGDGVQISGGNQTLCLNQDYYKALGSPAVDTLEQVIDYLKLAHETYPEAKNPMVLSSTVWDDSQDAINFIYRLCGGQEWLYDESGALKMCLRDPAYKRALGYMNQMFRAGLLTKDSFTMTSDQKDVILAAADTFAYIGQDFNWFGKIPGGDKEGSAVLPILAPMAEGLSRETDLSLDGLLSSIGGYTDVYISVDCADKARAIEYLAFRYTDEAQIAERFGIEGESYVWKDDGTIIWSDAYNEIVANEGWMAMSMKYGANNGCHSWFCTNYICKLESTDSDYWVRGYNGRIHRPYLKNERIYDLSKIIKDDDIQMKYDQFLILAGEATVKCVEAESDEAFERQFADFLSTAEGMGMDKLEEYFTATYQKWVARGL